MLCVRWSVWTLSSLTQSCCCTVAAPQTVCTGVASMAWASPTCAVLPAATRQDATQETPPPQWHQEPWSACCCAHWHSCRRLCNSAWIKSDESMLELHVGANQTWNSVINASLFSKVYGEYFNLNCEWHVQHFTCKIKIKPYCKACFHLQVNSKAKLNHGHTEPYKSVHQTELWLWNCNIACKFVYGYVDTATCDFGD